MPSNLLAEQTYRGPNGCAPAYLSNPWHNTTAYQPLIPTPLPCPLAGQAPSDRGPGAGPEPGERSPEVSGRRCQPQWGSALWLARLWRFTWGKAATLLHSRAERPEAPRRGNRLPGDVPLARWPLVHCCRCCMTPYVTPASPQPSGLGQSIGAVPERARATLPCPALCREEIRRARRTLQAWAQQGYVTSDQALEYLISAPAP